MLSNKKQRKTRPSRERDGDLPWDFKLLQRPRADLLNRTTNAHIFLVMTSLFQASSLAPSLVLQSSVHAYTDAEEQKAAQAVTAAAEKEGITGHAVALRWVLRHSALDASRGDGIVIGASSLGQLEENLAICRAGPLPAHLVQMVDEMGESVRGVAPPHSF